MLCGSNPQPVIVVKSPTRIAETKKFLGYEWSSRKGSEGIKYLGAVIDDEEDDISANKGIQQIQTPLFDPQNLANEEKINTLIRKNYLGEDFDVAEELCEFIASYQLEDMLDFKRVDFDKAIKTTPILVYPKIECAEGITTEKLSVVAPYVTKSIKMSTISVSDFITTDNMLQNRAGIVAYDGIPNIDSITEFKKGDILVSNIRPYLKKIWMTDRDGGCSKDVLVFRNAKPTEILNEYLTIILSTDTFFDYMMVGKKGVKMPRGDKKVIPNFEIPLPSLDIQEKIVDECKIVDVEVLAAVDELSSAEEQLISLLNTLNSNEVRLDSICYVKGGKRIPKGMGYSASKTNHPYLRVSDFKDGSIDVSDLHYVSESVFKHIQNYTISLEDVYISIAGTIGLVGIVPPDLNGANLTENAAKMIIKNHNALIKEYLCLVFNSPRVQLQIEAETKSIGVPKLALHRIESLMIPYIDKTKQEDIVSKATPIVEAIAKAKSIVKQATNRKQAILDKYLK